MDLLVSPRRALAPAVVIAAILTFAISGVAQAASLTRPEAALLRAMNSARAAHGLQPLRVDDRLVGTSRAHSRTMLRAQALFHGAFTVRIRRAGVRAPALGENLAWGSGSLSAARQIVDLWLQSPEHRANLLRPGFQTVGVGAVRGSFEGYAGALVVTTDFAGR
jgi:uncharacterized protein YkwD